MENWYASFINQNHRHRELLEAAARERLANQCQAGSRPAFRVQRLADLAVLIGIALMALGGVRHRGRSSQRRETQGTPGVAPRSVEA